MKTARIVTAIPNPFDGVLPDFTVFGVEFTQLWQKLLGGVWGLGIIASAFILLLAFLQMGKASVSQNPTAHSEAAKKALWAGIVLGALAAVAVITGAVLTFFG